MESFIWFNDIAGLLWNCTFHCLCHVSIGQRRSHQAPLFTAYLPISKGSVDSIYEQVMRTPRALLLKWRISPLQSTPSFGCIQLIINNSLFQILGWWENNARSPQCWRTDLFTGAKRRMIVVRPLPARELTDVKIFEGEIAKNIVDISWLPERLSKVQREASKKFWKIKSLYQNYRTHKSREPCRFHRWQLWNHQTRKMKIS